MTIDPGAEHYVVFVRDMPPTEVRCKCGARWDADLLGPNVDLVDEAKAHIEACVAEAER